MRGVKEELVDVIAYPALPPESPLSQLWQAVPYFLPLANRLSPPSLA